MLYDPGKHREHMDSPEIAKAVIDVTDYFSKSDIYLTWHIRKRTRSTISTNAFRGTRCSCRFQLCFSQRWWSCIQNQFYHAGTFQFTLSLTSGSESPRQALDSITGERTYPTPDPNVHRNIHVKSSKFKWIRQQQLQLENQSFPRWRDCSMITDPMRCCMIQICK